MAYIVSVDQSAVGTKGFIWDEQGALISRADIPHRQITNAAGWVSYDADELYRNSVKVVRQALHKATINP
jgi:glycerol kinase